jgi:hypothetical protein
MKFITVSRRIEQECQGKLPDWRDLLMRTSLLPDRDLRRPLEAMRHSTL